MTSPCPACGEPIAPDDGFCEVCGAELAPAAVSSGAAGGAPECPLCAADGRPPAGVSPEGYCEFCGRKVPSGPLWTSAPTWAAHHAASSPGRSAQKLSTARGSASTTRGPQRDGHTDAVSRSLGSTNAERAATVARCRVISASGASTVARLARPLSNPGRRLMIWPKPGRGCAMPARVR